MRLHTLEAKMTNVDLRVFRLQPPKTRKKIFKGKDADQFILRHEAIMSDGSIRNAFDVFDGYNLELNLNERIERFLTLWPMEYQFIVRLLCMERYCDQRLEDQVIANG